MSLYNYSYLLALVDMKQFHMSSKRNNRLSLGLISHHMTHNRRTIGSNFVALFPLFCDYKKGKILHF